MPRDDEYRGLVTPAGWAFALWGLIYTTEAASIAYQVSGAQQRARVRESDTRERLGWQKRQTGELSNAAGVETILARA
jgi:hypothetical protein